MLCRYLELTLQRKNLAYGDSTEKSAAILRLLWPDGIPPSSYYDARIAISVLDKLGRIATDRDALGESPWLDVAGYGILGLRHALTRATPSPEEEGEDR